MFQGVRKTRGMETNGKNERRGLRNWVERGEPIGQVEAIVETHFRGNFPCGTAAAIQTDLGLSVRGLSGLAVRTKQGERVFV